MGEIIQTIVSVEWIVLGIFFIFGLKKWNKKLHTLYEKFENDVKDNENLD